MNPNIHQGGAPQKKNPSSAATERGTFVMRTHASTITQSAAFASTFGDVERGSRHIRLSLSLLPFGGVQ